MEIPEKMLSRELANWLKYYRQLGFTHVYLRDSLRSCWEKSVAPLAGPALGTRVAQTFVPRTKQTSRPAITQPNRLPARGLPHSPQTSLSPIPFAWPSQRAEICLRRSLPARLYPKSGKIWGTAAVASFGRGAKTLYLGPGTPRHNWCLWGRGPGADEDEQGLPFVGRAGQLLTDMVEKGMEDPEV